jgi:hypothetical protein
LGDEGAGDVGVGGYGWECEGAGDDILE